ncbi:MAG: hypothetical protein ACT4OO_08865 [Nitrospiraceae bacterium]
MGRRTFSRRIAVAVYAGAVAAMVQAPVGAADGSKACGLVTLSELEAVLGTKVSLSGGAAVPAGARAEFCMGQAPTATVVLRLGTGLDPGREGDRSGGAEMKGIEIAKKMGAQVEVKTFFEPSTCSTMVPPANLAQYGFNTTCTVSKATAVAGIEVQAKSQKDMVSIEQLRPLAEKMAGRF